MKILCRYLALLIIFGLSSGCSNLPRNPAPIEQMLRAEVHGMPGVRAWSGTVSEAFEEDLLLAAQQTMTYARARGEQVVIPATNILSISGGGSYGAFGAGFMNGWSESGSRPQFQLVTGISTGALIATFAFLGPEYDEMLKLAYTTISAKDVYIPRWFSFLWSDAFTESTPLALLIKRYITEDMVQAVARAHRQGRRLYVGTTNLDADQLIVWNMGAIADSGRSETLALFRQIILASASIPGVFPPVLMDVEVDGTPHDEMHVDGGVKAQLFLFAATLDLQRLTEKLGKYGNSDRVKRIFIIRNAKVGADLKQVPRNLGEISARSISSLIRTQASHDLKGLYDISTRYGIDFNWVSIPDEYEHAVTDDFNTDEMNRLFAVGYEVGARTSAWKKVPPGMAGQ